MNSYLLYLPKATKRETTTLLEAGLTNLTGGGEKWFDQPRTPDDGPGLFCCWGDPRNPANGVAVVYDPSRQTWRKMLGGKYWLGIQNDRKPEPRGLAKPNCINGYAITLADGNEWVLPNVMALPAVFDVDDEGNEVKRTKAEYREIEDRAGWALGMLVESTRGTVLDETACRKYVAEMLAVNYRVTVEIVYALGLLDSECWAGAMGATVDTKRMLALRQEIMSGESAARTS